MSTKISCIYIIQNNLDHKIYIGQSINYKTRIKKHLKLARNDDPRHLYKAINYHRWENFTTFIIEDNIKLEEINEAEIFWISYFRSWDRNFGYNLTFGGGGVQPTVETKLKMSQAKLGKSNPKMQGEKHPLYGVTGEAHHRFGIKHTDEAKQKISIANEKREWKSGAESPSTKLTDADIIFMRKYFADNSHIKTNDILHYLAQIFKLSGRTIENIIYNCSWKHIAHTPQPSKSIKISNDDVVLIRQEISTLKGKPRSNRIKELTSKYGVNRNTIYDIINERTRK